ncbi:unnamed protein product [Brassica rapa]|uniref:Phorbol-ester/DAG-type domain-containing protein n=1 Tax=Brassica campestris TaxID=3711 RepID=A0A8D9CJM5_BRACM|nr:unnamed protein product [Brassica rapa]
MVQSGHSCHPGAYIRMACFDEFTSPFFESTLFVYDHQMESEGGVLLPLFHEHPMMPWNDLRRGDCCGRYESQSDGYYCKLCVFFVHKKCGNNELSQFIDHPSHPNHTLQLRLDKGGNICDLCGWKIAKLCYRCQMCDFDLDLHCAKYPPPDVIDNFETHPHKLTLVKDKTIFNCSAKCGKASVGLTYKCDECDVAFHVDCVWHPATDHPTEVNHSYHSLHPLKLLTGPPPDYSDGKCRLCGTEIDKELFYHCSSCNFTLDMPCVLNPPQKSLVDPKVHDHQLTLLPRLDSFTCNACGLKGDRSPYTCFDCGFMIHQDCLALPRVININRHDHRVSRTSVLEQMESEGVWLPFHEHPMMPWNDLRRGDCCGRYESQSDGYYCKLCVFFVHKKCGNDELSEFIDHPSHPGHTLELQHESSNRCDFCRWKISKLFYRCDMCDFDLDLHCAKQQPPNVIDNFETHPHKLILLKKGTKFDCSAKCGKASGGLPYKCDECDVSFHVDCVWHPATKINYSPEVNHPYHSLHPLKLLTGPPPDYSDGKCRLCGTEIGEYFYHCSSCNFTVDFHCVLIPPQKSLVDPKVHDHQLTLLPRLDSFTCNACGLKGDRSPYACFDCGFMIHQDCLGLPRVININRHDHRVSRTSVLGDAAMNSVCGVCRKKVDWTCGGFSCKRCPGYVVHSKCATRNDVWNGEELEGVPEEEEDTEPYVVIDENTIHHFSHEEHHLRRIHGNGIMYEENKRCSACTHPIGLQSFYDCMDCDFSLHQNCAECPKRRRHVLHNERLTLVTNKELEVFSCDACYRRSNGFMYKDEDKEFDVLCGSISEPFFHPSHPQHPLYYIPTEEVEICNGCNRRESHVLRCIEGDCGFALGFKCATLPQVVKNRVDDHPLSLCYGEEEEASGKYWCDICEKETDSKEWFYTCKDQRASLHTSCVLGDSTGLMPRSLAKIWGKSCQVGLNDSVTRPFCKGRCKDRCKYPIYFKLLGRISETYLCSVSCTYWFR